MTKQPSWADRRWKIFEQTYSSNAKLREELAEVKITVNGDTFKGDENVAKVAEIISKYNVPIACCIAVSKYLVNPNLDRSRYIVVVLPPFILWGTNNSGIWLGREMLMSNADWIKTYFRAAEALKTISRKDRDIDYEEIAKAVSLNPLIEVMPGTNKTELMEFINEYWDDIEAMFRDVRAGSEGENEWHFSEKLLGKVQPSKTPRHAERDEFIARLYNKGEKDYLIRMELRERGYGDLEENNIKQIRYKLGLTKKRTKDTRS